MIDRTLAIALTTLLVVLALAAGGTGSHEPREDERIVHPYNQQVIMHMPVVAGYEPFPLPVHCDAGAPGAGSTLYAEDFAGAHGWAFTTTTLAPTAPNLWHVTTFDGLGEEKAGNRLYFGFSTGPAAGTFNIEEHVAGSTESPWIALPADGEAVLSFTTKWQMEYLAGYDHMWVELLDAQGQVHLLCSNNSWARADAFGVGGDSLYSSCSPFLYSPCPHFPDNPRAPPLGEPGWEERQVTIPPSLMGSDVKIRLTFDTADGAANWFLGWMVHDVAITIL